MVTLSSIPNSTTRGPDANLSSDEGSKEVLEDFEDEPVMKTHIFNSDEDSDGDKQEAEAMSMCHLLLSSLLFLLFLLFLSISFFFFFFTSYVILPGSHGHT